MGLGCAKTPRRLITIEEIIRTIVILAAFRSFAFLHGQRHKANTRGEQMFSAVLPATDMLIARMSQNERGRQLRRPHLLYLSSFTRAFSKLSSSRFPAYSAAALD
jgi:hypothetical protein